MPVGWSFAPVRFTPTRVGTMGAPRSPLTSPTVHPHARGDDPYSAAVSVVVFGSPPRAWGRCASCPASSTWPTVHPHARGDDASRSCGPDVQNGSPPRAWGRCWRSGCRPGRRTVHPHARGDDRGGTGSRSMKYGSPPRAWGRFERLGQGGAERRFTPTRVGTISTAWPHPCRPAVHPHARGDDTEKILYLWYPYKKKPLEVLYRARCFPATPNPKTLLIVTRIQHYTTASLGLAAGFFPEFIAYHC